MGLLRKVLVWLEDKFEVTEPAKLGEQFFSTANEPGLKVEISRADLVVMRKEQCELFLRMKLREAGFDFSKPIYHYETNDFCGTVVYCQRTGGPDVKSTQTG